MIVQLCNDMSVPHEEHEDHEDSDGTSDESDVDCGQSVRILSLKKFPRPFATAPEPDYFPRPSMAPEPENFVQAEQTELDIDVFCCAARGMLTMLDGQLLVRTADKTIVAPSAFAKQAGSRDKCWRSAIKYANDQGKLVGIGSHEAVSEHLANIRRQRSRASASKPKHQVRVDSRLERLGVAIEGMSRDDVDGIMDIVRDSGEEVVDDMLDLDRLPEKVIRRLEGFVKALAERAGPSKSRRPSMQVRTCQN